jgi:hypothetical protein
VIRNLGFRERRRGWMSRKVRDEMKGLYSSRGVA